MSDVALITGAGNGLGVAIARAFHAAGYRTVFADIDGAAATAAAREADASGATAFGIALDVREPAQWESARDAILARWGALHVLVNNAAQQVATPLLDITPEEFAAVMATNVNGTFIGSQICGRVFKAAGYGRIVNLASLAGQNGGTATGAHYAASKGAIVTLTKVFARDLAAFGITVNAVAPGPLDLPSVRRLVPPEKLTPLIAAIPVQTLGDPAFVADIILRLAARDAGFTTGATWDINGGLYMR
jgi:3-oxoacyl-[acyl-carrier protein] reductase